MRFLSLLSLVTAVTSSIIKGISFYGLETPSEDLVCAWAHPPEHYLSQLKGIGFNTIRLPFSLEYVRKGNFDKMDHFINECCRLNLNLVLDLHRIWNSHQGPTPEEGVTLDDVVQTWLTVLHRYSNFPNIVGHNGFNEYQYKDIQYLQHYHECIFNAVEENFPGRYKHFASGLFWAGSIAGISLEHLPYKDRIVYSVHKYWFSGSGDEHDWEVSFGNEFPCNKIVIGEWGWKQQIPHEVDWATRFIAYLKKKGIRNTSFWTIAYSGDTDGIYFDDCENINWDKFNLLKTLWQEPRRLLRGSARDHEVASPTVKPIPIYVPYASLGVRSENQTMEIGSLEEASVHPLTSDMHYVAAR